ncbi:MAG: hypothetical protein QOD67_4950 [Caballeronia sp.]|nr:hypothetical protein [Caballeronia sp.]
MTLNQGYHDGCSYCIDVLAAVEQRIDGSFRSVLLKIQHAHKQDGISVYLQFVATMYP